jgi:hypothetical protein
MRRFFVLTAATLALVGFTAPQAIAQDVGAAAVSSSISGPVPNPAFPDSTSEVTFTFTTDGADSLWVSASLFATNGAGNYSVVKVDPSLTGCSMDPSLRAYGCDWNPTGAGSVEITLQINVGPTANVGGMWDVNSAIDHSVDQSVDLSIVAAPTTTTTTTVAPAPTTTAVAGNAGTGAAGAGEAKLGITG